MNDREYFQTTSLSYQLQAARRALAGFRSGEAYQKLRADYEGFIREKDLTIRKLQKELDGLSFSRRKITEQWMDVLEDVRKEHEKEIGKLKKAIAELVDMVVSLKNRNSELDEKKKKALSDYYETAVKLEEAQGLIVKLTAQVNHNYENSSLPSSKCIGRKKITNNREKSGKKPGAQAGHPHHPRRPMEPDQVIEIVAEEKFKDRSRYVPTRNILSRQVVGISIAPVVTEYRTAEFYDKKKGRNVHSAFPCGVTDDVNYDESMKAVLFLLNSRCNVSLEKTAQFVAQVLTPIYEEQFHDHSYGFRPNRCAQQAILTALDIMNDGNDWIVDIDLEKFFDTVNHDKLMTLIGRTIKDGDVISIVRKYLVSGIMIDNEYEDSIVGTPQGGNLSPLLANIMLNELDKEMEKRGLKFVRYADDCIIMVGSEMSANRVMRSISRFIEEKLGLKVNMIKSKVDRPSGLKYLGFGFYFDSRAHQYKAKPHAKSVEKFKQRMRELTCRSWGVSNSYKVEKLNQLIRGWINYFKIGSMRTLCRELDGNIRYRLRMCIWKHWKTPQNKEKNLVKLGVPRWAAHKVANTGNRYAHMCHNGWIQKAISIKRLTSFGLVSMLDYYTQRCVTC